jgi:hypothetical protein
VKHVIFILVLVLATPALAQSPEPTDEPPQQASLRELSGTLQQSAPPDRPIALGEPIPIEIAIVHAPGVDVVLPNSAGSSRWELLTADRETVEGEKEWTTTLNLTFAVYLPGETTLEPFPIELVSADGEGVLRSDPITVKVVSALEEGTEDFTAPRPPVAVWVEDNTLIWVGGFGASALLLGLFFIAARRRRDDDIVIAPPRPAHEVALEKLGRLAGDDMVERGEHMVFYVLMSEAVREYLGRRYGFKAVEMTTTEILDALDRADVQWPEALSRDDVANFLLHCDAVKFGGQVPSAETASEKLRRAFTIVETTRPKGLPVVENASAGIAASALDEPEDDVVPEEDPDARWRPPAERVDLESRDSETTELETADSETSDDAPALAEGEEERDGE